jgi:hypothetical protein
MLRNMGNILHRTLGGVETQETHKLLGMIQCIRCLARTLGKLGDRAGQEWTVKTARGRLGRTERRLPRAKRSSGQARGWPKTFHNFVLSEAGFSAIFQWPSAVAKEDPSRPRGCPKRLCPTPAIRSRTHSAHTCDGDQHLRPVEGGQLRGKSVTSAEMNPEGLTTDHASV